MLEPNLMPMSTASMSGAQQAARDRASTRWCKTWRLFARLSPAPVWARITAGQGISVADFHSSAADPGKIRPVAQSLPECLPPDARRSCAMRLEVHPPFSRRGNEQGISLAFSAFVSATRS